MIELRRAFTNPSLVIGLTGVIALLAIGVFGSVLAPFDPNAGTSLVWRFLPNGNTTFDVPPTLPDPDHWLGTDALGRDQWSRILAGAKLTLTVVLGAALVRLCIGFSLGIASGWYGGFLSNLVTVVAKGIAAFPQLLLAIMLVLATKQFGALGFIASLALVGWPEIVELVRAEVVRVKAQPFIEAARSIGSPGRRLIGTHLIAAVAPQLLSVAALETSAVLLLLAELGLLGLFLTGATFLVGDFGPVGPLKDRAPEWGQMLGTIQWYAILFQLGTLIPGLFIVIASAAFAFLADGLRAASDPYSPHRLLPGTFGVVTKGLVATICFSSVGLIAVNVQTTAMTMEQGRELSASTAQATWPGSVYVAGVARYLSFATQLTRPDLLTYYYRKGGEVLRISFLNADRLGVEVRPYETQDEIDFTILNPLPAGLTSYDRAVPAAEEAGGADFRQGLDNYLIRAILTWPKDRDGPVYEVRYGTNRRGELTLLRFCCVDARTGAPIGVMTKS